MNVRTRGAVYAIWYSNLSFRLPRISRPASRLPSLQPTYRRTYYLPTYLPVCLPTTPGRKVRKFLGRLIVTTCISASLTLNLTWTAGHVHWKGSLTIWILHRHLSYIHTSYSFRASSLLLQGLVKTHLIKNLNRVESEFQPSTATVAGWDPILFIFESWFILGAVSRYLKLPDLELSIHGYSSPLSLHSPLIHTESRF